MVPGGNPKLPESAFPRRDSRPNPGPRGLGPGLRQGVPFRRQPGGSDNCQWLQRGVKHAPSQSIALPVSRRAAFQSRSRPAPKPTPHTMGRRGNRSKWERRYCFSCDYADISRQWRIGPARMQTLVILTAEDVARGAHLGGGRATKGFVVKHRPNGLSPSGALCRSAWS